MSDLLVFTDLDGTLLDHHSYSCEPALPALRRLEGSGAPVIFNSSKTAAEIARLRGELGNRHPFVVENGSAVCVPESYFTPSEAPGGADAKKYDVHTFGPDYAGLLGSLHALRSRSGYLFRGFADLSAKELCGLTGLEESAAALAQQRHASEPLLWDDSAAALEKFTGELEELGLNLLKGGRFYHAMGRVDKAEALRWLTGKYRKTWPRRHWRTVALGDSPNDRAMLEAADLAVVIPAATGMPLHLERTDGVIRPKEPGPCGWQQAMSEILNHESDKGV